MIKLIIFDLDDTLYNEREYVLSGFETVARYVSRKTGIDFQKIYLILLESFILYGRGKNFDYLLRRLSTRKKITVPELKKIYQEHLPKIALSEKTIKMLKKLHNKYKLCLITNGWAHVQKRKVESLELAKYFYLIIYTQEGGLMVFRKPHPKYFFEACSIFKVKPKEALVVGDDLTTDAAGALAAGMRFYHINDLDDVMRLPKFKNL